MNDIKTFSNEELMKKLSEASDLFVEVMKELENEQETYWNSLTTEQQLMCFCAISRRIHKGEIEDGGTYRWVLYDVFGFGPEAYAAAQDAGYLAIHNSIMTPDQERKLLMSFAEHMEIPNPDESVHSYYKRHYV
jgi:hypothetical protein